MKREQRGYAMKRALWTGSLVMAAAMIPPPAAAQVNLSLDGSRLNLTASNESYGSILEVLGSHTGMEVDLPNELRTRRIPLLEIRGLGVKDAVVKIMEGSGFNYFLLARAGRPDSPARLIVSGKSKKITPPARSSRTASRPGRRPFVNPNTTPFNPRSGGSARVSARSSRIKPSVRPKAPPTPRPASPLPVGRPYGQTLSGQPARVGQPRPAQPAQVRSPQSAGSRPAANPSRRAPNPYERK